MVSPEVVVSSQTMNDFSKEEQIDYADLQRDYLENQIRSNEELPDGMTLRRVRRPPRIALWPALQKKLEQLHRHRLHGERYRLLKLLRAYETYTPKFGDTIPKDLLTPGLSASCRDADGQIDDEEIQEIIEIDHDSNEFVIEIDDDESTNEDGGDDNHGDKIDTSKKARTTRCDGVKKEDEQDIMSDTENSSNSSRNESNNNTVASTNPDDQMNTNSVLMEDNVFDDDDTDDGDGRTTNSDGINTIVSAIAPAAVSTSTTKKRKLEQSRANAHYKNKLRNTIQNRKNNNSFPHLASSVRAEKEEKHDANTNDNNDNNNDNGTKTNRAKSSSDMIESLKPTSEFPSQLHYLLQNAEKLNQAETISWIPSGMAFQVHKPEEFAEGMMLQCFDPHITKYESFQRQLYEFGFRPIEYGTYYHTLFVQDKYELCHKMIRTKNRIRTPSSAAIIPDQIVSTNNNIKRDDDNTTDAMDDVAVDTGTNRKRKLEHRSRDHLRRNNSKKGSIQDNNNNSTVTNSDNDDTNDEIVHNDDDDDGSYNGNNDDDYESENENLNDDDDNEWKDDNNGNKSVVVTNNTPMNKRALREQTQWDTIYERLVAYKKEHNTTSILCKYKEDPSLGHWVDYQRKAYQEKKLSNDRINRLNSIAFVWDPFAAHWKKMYERLVVYKEQNDSTCVPVSYEADPQLSSWVNKQRTNNNTNSSQFTKERKDQLNSIGFIWDVRDALWTEQYERLVAYKKEHKITFVPKKYKEDPPLGRWVNKQRKVYKNKKLSNDRINRLNSIAFVWDPLAAHWNTMYERLVEYKKQKNSTCVPDSYPADPQLAIWVNTQRTNYSNKSNSKFTGDRIRKLESIGFVWKVKK